MKINYVSLGSFCHPKIVIRDTGREYAESLPFDFNSSPSLSGVTNILRELYEKKYLKYKNKYLQLKLTL